jgi:hypothetical protein
MARRVSRKEKLASITGGAIDDRIPLEKWRARLDHEHGNTFDVDAMATPNVAFAIAYARGISIPGERHPVVPPRMEPKEIREQAATLAACADELLERLDALHPDLEMYVRDALWHAYGESGLSVVPRIREGIVRIRAAVQHGGAQVGRGKPGPKSTPWSEARDAVCAALVAHSTPRLGASAAREIAEDLLQLCGLKKPRAARTR